MNCKLLSRWFLAFSMACALGAGAPARAVWSYRDLVGSRPERERFFAFAARHRVDSLYLGASELLPGKAEPLAAFLQEAQARGIQVSLLLGRTGWVLPGQRGAALEQIRPVLAFTRAQRLQGRALPAGLHLDVEPHALPDWSRNWVQLAGGLLDLLEAVKAELNGELPLLVDIPVWWDSRNLERRGQVRPLCAWVIELADQTILMDYRNQVTGILRSAEGNLVIAEALGRKLRLGLDVHCADDPETLQTSFCRLGRKALAKAMTQVDRRLARRPSYGGLAIFTYEDWAELN